MGNEIGGAYIGQMIAKDAMHKALYGKAKKKKASIFARVMKKTGELMQKSLIEKSGLFVSINQIFIRSLC